MTQVICDTNIWYNIANGRITPEKHPDIRLHPTWVNLTELSRTPWLVGKPEEVQLVRSAITALHKYNSGIIKDDPLEYIIKKQHPTYERDDEEFKTILGGFEKLMRADVSKKLDDAVFEKMAQSIERWKFGLEQSAKRINDELLPGIRKNIKETTGKKAHRLEQSIPIFFDVINVFVREYTKGELALDVATYPWKEIEFFIRVWDNFFKELEVSQQKFKPNDWLDLLNMVYTSPGLKYSTGDGPWVRIIESDPETKPYLITLTNV